MIDEIMNAIARKLYSLFGDGYEIYKNSIEQDLQEPCFLISLVSADKKPMMGTGSFRILPFDILFFPSRGETQCYEVTEILMDELEYIDVKGDVMAGTKMRSEIVDDTLHFFVNYDFTIFRKKEETFMEMLETTNGIKE